MVGVLDTLVPGIGGAVKEITQGVKDLILFQKEKKRVSELQAQVQQYLDMQDTKHWQQIYQAETLCELAIQKSESALTAVEDFCTCYLNRFASASWKKKNDIDKIKMLVTVCQKQLEGLKLIVDAALSDVQKALAQLNVAEASCNTIISNLQSKLKELEAKQKAAKGKVTIVHILCGIGGLVTGGLAWIGNAVAAVNYSDLKEEVSAFSETLKKMIQPFQNTKTGCGKMRTALTTYQKVLVSVKPKLVSLGKDIELMDACSDYEEFEPDMIAKMKKLLAIVKAR